MDNNQKLLQSKIDKARRMVDLSENSLFKELILDGYIDDFLKDSIQDFVQTNDDKLLVIARSVQARAVLKTYIAETIWDGELATLQLEDE